MSTPPTDASASSLPSTIPVARAVGRASSGGVRDQLPQ